MPKRRGPTGRAPLDPEDVLAGRVKPTVGELLDLIHRVNPTGRELGAREAELRYAQKSRLQSLLVRRFASEIEVLPDPDREGTVSLRHRGHGRDGCHAVIAALDDDARAWVRLQVDLGAHLPEPPSAPAARPNSRGLAPPVAEDEEADDATIEALLRRAEQATQAYDYERARQDLAQAVSVSGGALEPAAALLALLVETLGDDAEALTLAASLPAATLAAVRTRGPLALAAARSGDEGRALAWVRGVDEAQAGAVFAALASAALAAGDADRAAGHLEQAKRRDPALPALASLAAEIARARALARGPAEAEIEELIKAGRQDEAERKASLVLARWPESKVARQALRAIEEPRRMAEIERLAAEAERMRALEAAERARREASTVERVRGLLGAPDPREGLLAYLELDETLRALIARQGGAIEALRLLDLTGRGPPRARAEAAFALGKARERVAADPEAALAQITPHLGMLERAAEARQLVQEAEARLAELRAARALAEVEAARAALAAGRAAEARRCLGETTLRDLPAEARTEAEALRARAAREAKVAEVGRLRAAGALLEARALAEELGAASEGEERARWARERAAIQGAIQLAFCVEVDDTKVPIGEAGGLAGHFSAVEAQRWLTDDGRAFVIAAEKDRWVIVRVIDLARLEARTTVVLRAPEPLHNVLVEVRGRMLWLFGGRGAVIALSMDCWEVQLFRPAAEVLSAGDTLDSFALVAEDPAPASTPPTAPSSPSSPASPGVRLLWVVSVKADGEARARRIDLDRRQRVREIPYVQRAQWIAGDRRMAFSQKGSFAVVDGHRVPSTSGRTVGEPEIDGAVAVHPSGPGLVALMRVLAPGGGAGLAWGEICNDVPLQLQPIEGTDGDRPSKIATAREEGVVILFFATRAGTWEIMALGESAGKLAPLYRFEVDSQTLLLQDEASRHVVAFQSRLNHQRAVLLGQTAPDLPLIPQPPVAWIKQVLDVQRCAIPVGERGDAALLVTGVLRDTEPSVALRAVRSQMIKHAQAPLKIIDMAHGLLLLGEPFAMEEARAVLRGLPQIYPDFPGVRVVLAGELAREGRWAEVREALSGLSADEFDDGRARHFDHLSALAALFTGDVEAARAAVLKGLCWEGPCLLDALHDLLTPLPSPLTEEAWGPERPPLVQIVGAVNMADGCLSRGDAEGALAALDRELFWTSGEVQLLGRLAEASLRGEPDGRRGRFRKIVALAKFLSAHREERPLKRKELPIPGAMWERARLDEVAARARAWLDAQGQGGLPPS